MRAPLEHQADVPERSGGKKGERGGERGTGGAEKLRGAIEKNGEAENEKRCERNEKAVAVRRDAGPIGVTGNEKVKREKGGEKRSADERFTAPENEKSDDGEKKNGRPGEKTVIGREKHREKVRRKPVPVLERNICGFEWATVNQIARDKGGEESDEESCGEQKVTKEKFGDARNCGGFGAGGAITERGAILADGFD